MIPESSEPRKTHFQLIPERPEYKRENESKTISIKGIVSERSEDYKVSERSLDNDAESVNDKTKDVLNPEGFGATC